jgi:hypothetical protein
MPLAPSGVGSDKHRTHELTRGERFLADSEDETPGPRKGLRPQAASGEATTSRACSSTSGSGGSVVLVIRPLQTGSAPSDDKDQELERPTGTTDWSPPG